MSEYGSIPEPGALRFERLLPGPIERVWAYLTESEKRATWLAAGPMELRVGGDVALHFHHADLSPQPERIPDHFKPIEDGVTLTGRVTHCAPPRLLAHSWVEPSGETSEVTFELTPRGDRVLLVLTHRRLGDRETMVSVASGWHTHLGVLMDRLNGDMPSPFWATHTSLENEYDKRL